jgi:hypothetical protein
LQQQPKKYQQNLYSLIEYLIPLSERPKNHCHQDGAVIRIYKGQQTLHAGIFGLVRVCMYVCMYVQFNGVPDYSMRMKNKTEL